MSKSRDAFRTISEVAEWLDTQPHVLRFWESKFSQVRPVKRAGGRRYYRPADMQLLGGIKKLLHDDGMTIKGVQKLLREKGIKEISALSPAVDSDESEAAAIEAKIAREYPEAIEKPEVDPLESQISEIISGDESEPQQVEVAAKAPAPTLVEPAPEPETPVQTIQQDAPVTPPTPPSESAPKTVPRNPLADVAESWSNRESLISTLMKTQDVEAAHHAEIAQSLKALEKLIEGNRAAASS